jgi:hypothetical protein
MVVWQLKQGMTTDTHPDFMPQATSLQFNHAINEKSKPCPSAKQ